MVGGRGPTTASCIVAPGEQAYHEANPPVRELASRLVLTHYYIHGRRFYYDLAARLHHLSRLHRAGRFGIGTSMRNIETPLTANSTL